MSSELELRRGGGEAGAGGSEGMDTGTGMRQIPR